MANQSIISRFFKRIHPESIPWPGSVLYNLLSSSVIFQKHYEMVAEDISPYCTAGRLLDIGTGPAWLLLKIHQKSPQLHLVGLDSSDGMVVKAKENTARISSIEIQQGNASNLSFPDNSFDIVISTASLHHWKQPVKSINEIYRVLKPNGFAIIYDLVKDTPKSVLDDCKRQFGSLKTTFFWLHSFEEPFYTQEDFEALAAQSLFKNCETKFLGLLYCLVMEKR